VDLDSFFRPPAEKVPFTGSECGSENRTFSLNSGLSPQKFGCFNDAQTKQKAPESKDFGRLFVLLLESNNTM
jgi:hypothetical protein